MAVFLLSCKGNVSKIIHSNNRIYQNNRPVIKICLGSLLIVLDFFVFGSCPVRNAMSSLINEYICRHETRKMPVVQLNFIWRLS